MFQKKEIPTHSKMKRIGCSKIVIELQEVFDREMIETAIFDEENKHEKPNFVSDVQRFHPSEEEGDSYITEYAQRSSKQYVFRKRRVKMRRHKLFLFLNKIFKFFPIES